MKVGSALPEPPVRGVRHVPDLPGTPPEGGREHPHRLEPLPRRPEGAGRDPRPALVRRHPRPSRARTGAASGSTTGTMVTAAVRRPRQRHAPRRPGRAGRHRVAQEGREKILWREGDDLINGERFFAMEQLCYSDAATVSINKRALAVFDYLKHVPPGRQRRDRCRQHGLHARRDPAHTGRGAGAGRRLRRRGPDEDDTPEEEDGEDGGGRTAIPFDFA